MRLLLVLVATSPILACGSASHRADTSARTALANMAGIWEMKEFDERGASVGAFRLVATADTSGWQTVVPNRPPISRRVVAYGGDSVVNEIGPFESGLRPGVQVRTREVLQRRGDTLFGSIVAHYMAPGPDSLRRFLSKGTRAR